MGDAGTIDVYAERFTPKTTGTIVARATANMSLAVDQVMPDGYELSRAGRRFMLCAMGATGIAPVQALPTTAAQWTLFNTSTTVSLIFDWLGVINASGTEGAGLVMLATLFTTPAQTGLASSVTIQNCSNSTKGSAVAVKSGVTITAPSSPNWFPVAGGAPTTTALEGLVQVYDIRGRIVVPPSTGLGVAVVSPTGTSPLYVPTACWCEVESDLE